MSNKLEVMKKVLKGPCYVCNGSGKKEVGKRFEICKVCEGTGIYKENYYYHIVNGICFDGDSLK